MAKKKKQTLKTFLTGKLRSASLLWHARDEVFKRIRTSRGIYECEICEGHFKKNMIDIDHKNPIVNVELGFIDWNNYIENLFCDADDLQGICKTCHSIKTEQEKEMRTFYKRKKKGDHDE